MNKYFFYNNSHNSLWQYVINYYLSHRSFDITLLFSSIRASTSVCAKLFPFCTSKTYFFYFTCLFLQNTSISLSIIHIYSNKIFIFLTLWIVTVRGERKEKRVRWREEREKKNKKINYMVNSNRVYIHGYCSFARLLYIFRYFYKDWCKGFLG